MTQVPAARILMCAPRHFEVSYIINPWMRPDEWGRRRAELADRSARGWTRLVGALEGLGAEIVRLDPVPGLPDLVFTANAAVVLDGVALVARFRHAERQGETAHVYRLFDRLQADGLLRDVEGMPAGVRLEGAGDCVWDEARQLFWLGHGQRSDAEAAEVVAAVFGREVVPLQLADPRFYHMDTCLSPLPRGEVMVVPGAFTAAGLDEIAQRVGRDRVIPLSDADAAALAANAVVLGDDIVLSHASDALRAELAARGYRVHEVAIPEFGLSGGSCFCLTLRLDRASRAPDWAAYPAAAACAVPAAAGALA